MYINCTTIPDIPADLLSTYSYAIIVTSGTSFYLGASKSPGIYIPASVSGNSYDSIYISSGEAAYYTYTTSDSTVAWTDAGVQTATTYSLESKALAWSNHEIYTGASDGNGGYIATTEVSFGEEYIPPVGLYALPAGILNTYPYVAITSSDGEPTTLAVSSDPMTILDMGELSFDLTSLDSAEEADAILFLLMLLTGSGIKVLESPVVIYTLDSSTKLWVVDEDTTSVPVGGFLNCVSWTNEDLFRSIPTDMDGGYELTEKLLAPRGFCEFPTLGNWADDAYPYRVMAVFDSGSETDRLYLASSEPFYAIESDGSYAIFSNLDPSGVYYPPILPNAPMLAAVSLDGAWLFRAETSFTDDNPYSALISQELMFGLINVEKENIWSSHDIHHGTFTETFLFQPTDEVYVSGSETTSYKDVYWVNRAWLVQNAYRLRKLSGVSDSFTPGEMRSAGDSVNNTYMMEFIPSMYKMMGMPGLEVSF